MCLSPILIKNVNYGNTSKLSHIKDSSAQFIPVPCGRCSVCLALKQNYLVQRVQMESLSHDLYFGTLTYNNESLPTIKVGEFSLNYVDISDWQKMLKMIRKHEDLPPFKYFLVTEYGGKRHRPHIHFILSFPKDDKQILAERVSFELKLKDIFLQYWRRNLGSTRSPVWQNLCTYVHTRKSYNYDLHYLNPSLGSNGLEDVAFYTTKYCLKFDKWLDSLKSKLFFNLPESEYTKVWDLLRPRRLISKGFGSFQDPKVIEHINKGIDLSLSEPSAMFPYFISPVTGDTFPLSPYYSKKFLTLDDLEIFNQRKPTLTVSDMMVDSTPELSVDERLHKQEQFDIVCDYLDNVNTYIDSEFNLSNDLPDEKYKTSNGLHFKASDYWESFDYDFDNDT